MSTVDRRKARTEFRMSLGANPATCETLDWWQDATSLGPDGPFDCFTVLFTSKEVVIQMVSTKVRGHLRKAVSDLERISRKCGYTRIILDSRNEAVWTALGFSKDPNGFGDSWMVKYI